MDDRTLLEKAAQAAGFELEWEHFDDDDYTGWSATIKGTRRCWNPLTDDGDALRLAVKLNIDFKAYKLSVRALAIDDAQTRIIASIEEPIEGDPYAATRRAIVRAAAALSGAGTRTASDE